jgi:hypothetical protein
LGRLRAFCDRFGWWPSATELAAFIARGSRFTAWSDLRRLRSQELVALLGGRGCSRWVVTDAGFAFLGLPAVVPRFARRPASKAKTRLGKRVAALRRREAAVRVYATTAEIDADWRAGEVGADGASIGGLETVD